MTLYDELVARGLIAQVTDEEKVKEMINNGKATFYIGFDPTADSLHGWTLHGSEPDEAPADGGHAHRPHRRRHHHDRRPLRPHRHAEDAHQGGHRPQRRLLQEADGAASSISARARPSCSTTPTGC